MRVRVTNDAALDDRGAYRCEACGYRHPTHAGIDWHIRTTHHVNQHFTRFRLQYDRSRQRRVNKGDGGHGQGDQASRADSGR